MAELSSDLSIKQSDYTQPMAPEGALTDDDSRPIDDMRPGPKNWFALGLVLAVSTLY